MATEPTNAAPGREPRRRLPRLAAKAALVAIALLGMHTQDALATPGLAGSLTDATNLPKMTSVAVAGNYAYATVYDTGRLAAIDVSSPSQPTLAGQSVATTAMLNAVTVNVSGGYAYVVSKNRNASATSNDDGTGNSFTILDIHTDPANPIVVGSVTDPVKLFGAYGVAVSGTHAYVAAQGCLSGQPCPNTQVGDRLVVIDISNRSNPAIVTDLHNTTSGSNAGAFRHASAVAIVGNYAYVTAAYQHRLTVVDISNPNSPQIAGIAADAANLPLDADVDVDPSGSYAYVAVQSSGVARLTVVDVRNKSAPAVVGSVQDKTALDGAYRVRVRGTNAYVATAYSNSVARVDVSDPANPAVTGYVLNSKLNPGVPAGSLQTKAPLGKPEGIDLDSSGRYAFASATGSSSLASVDLLGSPPTVALTGSKPAANTSQRAASFTFSTNDPTAKMTCQLDGAGFSPCTSRTAQQYASLADGQHTFTVKATDGTNQSATAGYTWTVDTVAPTLTIAAASNPADPTTANSGQFVFSTDSQAVNVVCAIDGNTGPCTTATSESYGPLALGAHKFVVTASDAAGNSASAQHTWTIVALPPSGAQLPQPQTPQQQPQAPTKSPVVDPRRAAAALLRALRSSGLRGLEKHRVVTARFYSPGAGDLAIKITAAGRSTAARAIVIATGRKHVSAAKTTSVRLRLSAKGLRLLRAAKSARFRVRVTATGSGVAPTVQAATVFRAPR